MHRFLLAMIACELAFASAVFAEVQMVRNHDELRQALVDVEPGTTIRLESGVYRGGNSLENIQGAEKQRIVIEGANPDDPPVFTGGRVGWHLSACHYLTLRNLLVVGFTGGGINIDDGEEKKPAVGVRVENVTIRGIGPRGNRDALKLSGLDHFVVTGCRFEGWGGSAIDMVGCHHGVVEQCEFIGRTGYSQTTGVQMKGGSRGVTVRQCFFDHAGSRAINIGGSTGLRFFRPQAKNYEAKEITVAGNRFIGSTAPIAWATADGGRVHHNTFYLPEKWVVRILQDNEDERFRPCHGGVFENNLIVFDERVRIFANVGPNTAAETFTFRKNAWFDASDRDRTPELPATETGGIYHVDPMLKDPGSATMRIGSDDARWQEIGADAFQPKAAKPSD